MQERLKEFLKRKYRKGIFEEKSEEISWNIPGNISKKNTVEISKIILKKKKISSGISKGILEDVSGGTSKGISEAIQRNKKKIFREIVEGIINFWFSEETRESFSESIIDGIYKRNHGGIAEEVYRRFSGKMLAEFPEEDLQEPLEKILRNSWRN